VRAHTNPTARSAAASRPPDSLAEIRALERADLAETTALFELALGSGVRSAEPALMKLFERTLLDNPWVDPELPSLVALDERGRIIGFIGAEVLRMRFRDRTVRAVWSQHFVVDPAARRLGVGAVLLRRRLRGAQDITLTDNGSPVVQEMWKRLGGEALDVKGIHWIRVFRPWREATHTAAMRTRPRLQAALSPLAATLDAVTVAGAPRYVRPRPVEDTSLPLTPRLLLDALPAVTSRLKLYPDYDEAFLEWLFRELVTVEQRGRLVAQLVQDRSGQPLGWYLYYLRPGRRSEVLQVVARERDAGRVLDHLLYHAYTHGSAAVQGRLEAGWVEAIAARRCLLRHVGGALAHSPDPELVCAMHSAQTLATRLEGEWWGESFL
jgi:GNAT superfamily N-acetyltransferase